MQLSKLYWRRASIGLIVTLVCSIAGQFLAKLPGFSLIGHLVLALLLGMCLQFARSLTAAAQQSTPFIANKFLRAGIILLGFKLNLVILMSAGLKSLEAAVVIVAVMIPLNYFVARFFKVEHTLALLTACGCSICGAAAVLGAEPVVKCEGYKTAIAVSTVVIFGTLSMFLYPVMYRMGMLNGMTDTEVAVYTGSTLHEVAHVAGAGNAMDPTDALGIAGTATITKMIRVMLLAPVLVIMGFVLAGRRKESGGETGKRRIAVPWFAFGFIGVIGLNSLLQSLCGVETVREIPLNGTIEYVDTFMLTMAMTALGTETSLDKFRQAGARPFVLAGLLYVWLVAGGYFVTKYVVGML